MGKVGSFGAHYKIKDDKLINFAGSLSLSLATGKDMHIKIWEYKKDSFDVTKFSELTVPGAGFAFIHDWVVSDNYYAFFLNACDLDIAKFTLEYMTGKCSLAECI